MYLAFQSVIKVAQNESELFQHCRALPLRIFLSSVPGTLGDAYCVRTTGYEVAFFVSGLDLLSMTEDVMLAMKILVNGLGSSSMASLKKL